MGLRTDIALTHLRGRVRQSLVSVLGVATGVGFFIAIASLMQGSQDDFIATLVDTTPHVVVRDEYRDPPVQPVERAYPGGAVALEGVKPKEELRGIRAPRRVLEQLDALPGIAAAPSLRGQVVMRYGGRDEAAAILGIEPARERLVSQLEADMVAGSLDSLYGAANGLIIGDGLAEKLQAGVGDTIAVSSAAGVFMLMKVVGLFHTGVAALDEGEVYALVKKVQVLQDRPNVINQIRLRIADVQEARAVARAVEARLGYRTESWDEANSNILEAFVVRNVILYTVVSAILLVAGFGIFNVISTVTYEKARDIAILKSLGFRESDVLRIFVLEGLAVGVAGAVLGWLLGWLLCLALGMVEFRGGGMIDRTSLPLYEGPLFYAMGAVFAVAAAVIASYVPARKAARVNPVDIIRGAA